ncbi:MAG: bifunctional phosphopantothenoylcysteine decarboxylase/phosphopantothenate--cysteine ligase CoaBC [[Eubacterium] sulci]|nr:bifunctional phosphopantothenoylcysteine decarboxylase/phosphopantothenate--cysteine ligase CoaBC [[Eubacterium] sulci]MBF1176849.1 bifunctional phosphopantothenoylcysteine decarboxylase/phosphopantothenate--cysteine ligase CoaBC [[Eubacterium] sulci]
MFENKSIIIGVSGGIAAYKTAYLVSALSKTEADVNVIMTKNACEFISPLVFETLTGNKCYVDTFDRNFKFDVEHISLAKKADIFMIAPATANVIAKIANGIADDMLTTTFLASKCKKIVSPAMNTAMFENQITQDNIAKLKKYEIGVVEPRNGLLACGDTGAGKMPEPDFLFDVIEREIAREKDMLGKKVLVTAGATMESLDPVRFLTNHSSGKMGFAIAKEAMLRGAEVTVVKANTTAEIPNFVKIVEVSSAKDMFDEVTALSDQQDIIVKAAAVADYTPESYVDSKIKKKDGDLSIPLKRTMDILKYLGENKKEGQFLCGFSMETDNMLENSKAKLSKKNADMIVANNLRDAGSGFKTDTNAVTLITRDGHRSLELKSKAEVAKEIFDEILGLI